MDPAKFKVNDSVRMSKYVQDDFWEELHAKLDHRYVKVKRTNLITYLFENYSSLQFYEHELHRAIHP